MTTLSRTNLTSALRATLALRQNVDGGWGLAGGFGSNPLDTALALRSLAGSADLSPAGAVAATQFLLAQQNADGGWGSHVDGPSRTLATVEVMEALASRGSLDPALAGALAFLSARQNADGGFGDSPSTAHDTALVLNALVDLQATEGAAVDLGLEAHGHLQALGIDVAGELLGAQVPDPGNLREINRTTRPMYRRAFPTHRVVVALQQVRADGLDPFAQSLAGPRNSPAGHDDRP